MSEVSHTLFVSPPEQPDQEYTFKKMFDPAGHLSHDLQKHLALTKTPLPPEQRPIVRAHLESCAGCRASLSFSKKMYREILK